MTHHLFCQLRRKMAYRTRPFIPEEKAKHAMRRGRWGAVVLRCFADTRKDLAIGPTANGYLAACSPGRGFPRIACGKVRFPGQPKQGPPGNSTRQGLAQDIVPGLLTAELTLLWHSHEGHLLTWISALG